MKKYFLLTLLSLLAVTSCGSNNKDSSSEDGYIPDSSSLPASSSSEVRNSSSEAKAKGTEIPITISGYDTKVYYQDEYFDQSSASFNKDLALFAYGASVCTGSKASISSFYQQASFGDVATSISYNTDPTENSIAYAFASKTVGTTKVVIASIRGFNYGREWSSNLDLGKNGNHHGFESSANDFISGLDSYITSHNIQSPKILVTGYSRGGGVANVAADILFKKENDQKVIPDSNYYFYTFEAPRGLATHEAYTNVFNVINSADLITKFAPEEYGLYRCGIDVDIYNADVDNIVKSLDESITLPPFTSSSSYENEEGFDNYLIANLTSTDAPQRNISTRENFVDNIEETAQYVMKMFFSLSDATIAQLKSDASEKTTSDLLAILGSGQTIHDFIKPYLDADHYVYDDTVLLEQCNILYEFLMGGPGAFLLLAYGLSQDNFMRAINMHYPEVNFALLQAYALTSN